jgi:ClpP class serine protease
MFAEKVSEYTGMSVQAVLDTEAAVFTGQESIDHGLADELVNNTDALNVMRESIDKKQKTTFEVNMNKATTAAVVPASAVSAVVAAPEAVGTAGPATAALSDVSAQIAAAVNAEQGRIMGILNCEAAQGREAQARALADTPGMTLEHAQRILATSPQSAQFRTETALDKLMENSPAALGTATPASDDADDLMNTPV